MTDRSPATTGMHSITPHIVVRDADAASNWYRQALGAVERTRLTLPNGKVVYAELHFGDSAVMVADEFPDAGIVSPLAIGGNAVVLHLCTEDGEALWRRASGAGAEVVVRSDAPCGGDRRGEVH